MRGLLALPRVQLATAPTPLHPAPRLSEAIGVEVWLKRDDLTGLGLGGNKVRALEYLLADALAQGCDSLVTGAGPQSNWAMLAALAARRCGLDPFLAFYGPPVAATGNLFLDEMVGADVRFTGEPDRMSVDTVIDALAAELRDAGRRPYLLPRGGATALGAVGYARASLELAGQLMTAGIDPSALWLATGSCGTQAGLVAGARRLGASYEVVGVTVSRPVDECVRRVSALAAGVTDLLDLSAGAASIDQKDINVVDGFLGPGYGLCSPEGQQAAQLVARTEGVFLDPVFGAKAMAALLATTYDAGVDGPVVFLVTGGAPTLFSGAEGGS
jgi:D-cysteine desulfhydrase